eukprot:TRINITY_DN13384_c0_g1_i1.p1 TRINITY_DN13384_c0_g1~~TRINITY_DN13384_c0_g1_i1.p1  ORF type:complete len:856 (+),score=145.60 TRINITY_DN13384_c0_g1_i1:149-2716(+)
MDHLYDGFVVVGGGTGSKEGWVLHSEREVSEERRSNGDADILPCIRFEPKIEQVYPKSFSPPVLCEKVCMPQGVSVKEQSYDVRSWDVQVDKPIVFSTVITARDGSRLYAVALQFFDSVASSDLPDLWHAISPPASTEVKVRRSVVRVASTRALVLFSKYPLLLLIEQFLLHVYRMVGDSNRCCSIEVLLSWFHQIPIPSNNVWLSIPLGPRSYKIASPDERDCLPFIDCPLHNLFKWLSLESIIILLTSVLLERKIIVCADKTLPNSAMVVSSVVMAITKLIFPFEWHHVFIPMLPEWDRFREILHAPVPYLLGAVVSGKDDKLFSKIPESEAVVVRLSDQAVTIPELGYLPSVVTKSLLSKLGSLLKPYDLLANPFAAKLRKKGERLLPGTHHSFPKTDIQRIFYEGLLQLFSGLLSACQLDGVDDFGGTDDGFGVVNAYILKFQSISSSKFFEEFADTQLFRSLLQKTSPALEHFNEVATKSPDHHSKSIRKMVTNFKGSVLQSLKAGSASILREIPIPRYMLQTPNRTSVDPGPVMFSELRSIHIDPGGVYGSFPLLKMPHFSIRRNSASSHITSVQAAESWKQLLMSLRSLTAIRCRGNKGWKGKWWQRRKKSSNRKTLGVGLEDVSSCGMTVSPRPCISPIVDMNSESSVSGESSPNVTQGSVTNLSGLLPIVSVDAYGSIVVQSNDVMTTFSFNTSIPCMNCSLQITEDDITSSSSTTLTCKGCEASIIPHFSVFARVVMNEGAPACWPVRVNYLSESQLVREVENLIRQRVLATETLLETHPTTFWNVLRVMRTVSIPLDLLMPQASWSSVPAILKNIMADSYKKAKMLTPPDIHLGVPKPISSDLV